MKTFSLVVVAAIGIELAVAGAQAPTRRSADAQRATPSASKAVVGVKANIPYAEAKPILQTLREDLIPGDLRAKTPTGRESLWPRWVSQRDREIRARLERGDEDSIVNFLLFGVTFTKRPRSKLADLLDREPAGLDLLRQRVDDLVAGVASPAADERLQFVRRAIRRKGIDPTAAAGKDRVRSYVLELTGRVLADIMRYDPTIQAAAAHDARVFRDRGLASDTTISTDFAIDQALEALKAKGVLAGSRVRRVAVVGPGLDFIDKYEGYDFYPQQTIQPFAVIDSLTRLGLAAADLRMTTFDLSPRINQHIEAARRRARAGESYVVHVPRDTAQSWSPGLVKYWERFGDAVGEPTTAAAAPSPVDNVEVRTVRMGAPIVLSIVPRDVNIVLQRLAPLSQTERFDLIVGTNILVYYEVFEQSLALANIASMLRPGGLFLCNDALVLLPPTPMNVLGYTDVTYNTALKSGDRVMWYQRN